MQPAKTKQQLGEEGFTVAALVSSVTYRREFELITSLYDSTTRPLPSARSWLMRIRDSPWRTIAYPTPIGGNACTRNPSKNTKLRPSFQVTGMILNTPLPWNKDFVQRAGKALSVKVLKPRWRNARLGTRLRTRLLRLMPNWGKKIRLSSG